MCHVKLLAYDYLCTVEFAQYISIASYCRSICNIQCENELTYNGIKIFQAIVHLLALSYLGLNMFFSSFFGN
jgi:hypothetical protein